MQAICSECNKTYEEKKEELFFLIGHVDMICYECAKKYQLQSWKDQENVKMQEREA